MKSKKISIKNIPVYEKEAEASGKAYKGFYRNKRNIKGYNLNKTGIIKSLYNFIESSNWEPSYFKDRRNVPHLNFSRTADIWATNLHEECKHEDWTADWKPDDRNFRCENDYLDNNTPNFQVLGGRVSVHKSTKKELDNRAKIVTVEDIGYDEDRGEEYYNTMAQLLDEEDVF
jgi:hypothetical protein